MGEEVGAPNSWLRFPQPVWEPVDGEVLYLSQTLKKIDLFKKMKHIKFGESSHMKSIALIFLHETSDRRRNRINFVF